MNGELRPVLEGYRRRVERAWSAGTSHPEYNGAAGSPVGQCGVTSAWLRERLLLTYGVRTTFCVRAVYLNHNVIEDHHCWLEIGEDERRLVIDVTADQMPGVSDFPVLYASHAELLASDIGYAGLVYRQRYSPDLMGRLALLKEAL